MTVEGQRYLEECRKVLKEEQMDAVSMGLDFGLPVSDIQKVVKSNQEAPVMKAIIIGLMEGIGEIDFLCEGNYNQFQVREIVEGLKNGLDLEEVKKELLKVNNLAVEGKPEDMVITSHICRGNYHSTFFTSGPYDTVADYVFAKENVDALFLEYDDERSGGFAPLAKVSPDKKVVLGLITTKSPELEDKERVIHRINEAAKYVPLERLYLSPQCGFASCEIGNKLTEEQQWEKLKLVKEIAEEVWGE